MYPSSYKTVGSELYKAQHEDLVFGLRVSAIFHHRGVLVTRTHCTRLMKLVNEMSGRLTYTVTNDRYTMISVSEVVRCPIETVL